MRAKNLSRIVIFLAFLGWVSACSYGKKAYTTWPDDEDPFLTRPEVKAMRQGFNPRQTELDRAKKTLRQVRFLGGQLKQNYVGTPPEKMRVVVTYFSDRDNPSSTGKFGKFAAEQVMGALKEGGFETLEINASPEVQKSSAEGSMTPESGEEQMDPRAQAVVVGNYSVSGEKLLVNAKMLKVGTSELLSTGSVLLDLTFNPFLVEMLGVKPHLAKIHIVPKVLATDPSSVLFQKKMEDLAYQVDLQIKNRQLGQALIVTTFVDLNNLYRTSALGRYASQQMMEILHNYPYKVIEVRKSMGLLIENDMGEFTLSRDAQVLFSEYTVDLILAGTYSRSGDRVVFNAYLIRAGGNEVLSVGRIDFQIPEGDKFIKDLADREVTFVNDFQADEGF